MKMKLRVLILLLAVGVLTAGNVFAAVDYGAIITIFDGHGPGGSGWRSTWWSAEEDDEVESPVTIYGQSYDLEGFVSDGMTLSMVGGYNSWNPPRQNVNNGHGDMNPGDIFIAVDGLGAPVEYGKLSGSHGTGTEPNIWGYDFVYDLDFNNNTYSLYAIDESTRVRNVLYKLNRRANPWAYASGGTFVESGTFAYLALSDDDLSNYGYSSRDANPYDLDHYAVRVDLTLLPIAPGTGFTAHFAMECGNDNLMGYGTTRVPDGGATLALLGSGLLGLALLKRTLAA